MELEEARHQVEAVFDGDQVAYRCYIFTKRLKNRSHTFLGHIGTQEVGLKTKIPNNKTPVARPFSIFRSFALS